MPAFLYSFIIVLSGKKRYKNKNVGFNLSELGVTGFDDSNAISLGTLNLTLKWSKAWRHCNFTIFKIIRTFFFKSCFFFFRRRTSAGCQIESKMQGVFEITNSLMTFFDTVIDVNSNIHLLVCWLPYQMWAQKKKTTEFVDLTFDRL